MPRAMKATQERSPYDDLDSAWLTADQLCRVLRCSQQTVSSLALQGVLVRSGGRTKADPGKFQLADSIQRYLLYKLRAAKGDPTSKQLVKAKLTKLRAEARLAQLRVWRAESKLVPYEFICDYLGELIIRTKNAILMADERIPMPDETRKALKENLMKALNNLAQIGPQIVQTLLAEEGYLEEFQDELSDENQSTDQPEGVEED